MVKRYLLDTHTFLWASHESRIFKLGEAARDAIEDPDSELYVSAASMFEISNKYRTGKLPEYRSIAENCLETLEGLDARELPLNWEQANIAGNLDWQHKDPFDRMLAAQAQLEDLILISCDKVFDDVPNLAILW